MGSFIDIPRRYDISAINALDIVCTDHRPAIILRRVEGGFVGVDEILMVIEEHEKKHHSGSD